MTEKNTDDIVDYEGRNFIFQARVVRVVDGDTIYCDIDLGFHIRTMQMLRFSVIDTPEIYHPKNEAELQHGREAKEYLENLILGKDVWVKTRKTGKFGRWIANVYLMDGTNVQRLLIENGFEKRESYPEE
jgi:micrococcal nuclease